jgi:hypothetical protein
MCAKLICLVATLFWIGRPATVEMEEVVATCKPPNNGAGLLWCYGAPLLVRQRDVVFANVMETGEGVPPLSNTRWRLFQRDARGWRLIRAPEAFRNREPCPLVSVGPDQLVLSVNPSTEPPGTQYGRCDPLLLYFDTRRLDQPPRASRPTWSAAAHFTDHSYQGIAADPNRGEILLLNIEAKTSAQHWSLATADGRFSRTGALDFPIRACYPQVALRNGAAHVLAVGDIVEPNEAWRTYKKQQTGRSWDYVFRRLFYAWSGDLRRGDFSSPLEIDTVDAIGGHITNLDLWIDPRGTAHLLYLKTNLSPVLRDRFFPGQEMVTTLEHAEVADGKIIRRTRLLSGGEKAPETVHYARFHATDDGTLWAVVFIAGRRSDGSAFAENRVFPVRPGQQEVSFKPLPLKIPLSTFFTAAERGGSQPSDVLDMVGSGPDGQTLRYAKVRLR